MSLGLSGIVIQKLQQTKSCSVSFQQWPLYPVTKSTGSCTGSRLFFVIKREVQKLSFKKKWFASHIRYYPNSVATFNYLALTILLSGDVHPLLGPEFGNHKWIPVRLTNRLNQQRNSMEKNQRNLTKSTTNVPLELSIYSQQKSCVS